MNKIDVLAYKSYSYDTDSFIEDIICYSPNSIILIFDFDKIHVHYKPANIRFRKNDIKFLKFNNQRLNYYLSPFLLLLYFLIYIRLFTTICWRYRPKVCWIENSYAALIIGILRKFRMCNKSIYVPGDWVAGVNYKNFFKNILNNFVFPIVDYIACKFNDVVLNHVEEIAKARYKFWGKKIAEKESIYRYKLRIRVDISSINKESKSICFLGTMRIDSGLDMVIKSLDRIRKYHDITLKIIGHHVQDYDYLKRLTEQYQLDKYVQFLGFVPTERLPEILPECFCGINVLSTLNSYSSYTIPGKLMHYLQHILPVIATEGVGPCKSVIRENELGVIIEPSQDMFIDAVLKVYSEQKQYKENIIHFINSLPEVDFKEMVENS